MPAAPQRNQPIAQWHEGDVVQGFAFLSRKEHRQDRKGTSYLHLEHVTSMIELAAKVCDHYGDLDRDLMVVGVLFHDLGKVQELGAMPANDYTKEGRLVGHIVLGRDLLRERCAAIPGFPAELQVL